MPWHEKQSKVKIVSLISQDCSIGAVPFSFPYSLVTYYPQILLFYDIQKMLKNAAHFLINPKRY